MVWQDESTETIRPDDTASSRESLFFCHLKNSGKERWQSTRNPPNPPPVREQQPPTHFSLLLLLRSRYQTHMCVHMCVCPFLWVFVHDRGLVQFTAMLWRDAMKEEASWILYGGDSATSDIATLLLVLWTWTYGVDCNCKPGWLVINTTLLLIATIKWDCVGVWIFMWGQGVIYTSMGPKETWANYEMLRLNWGTLTHDLSIYKILAMALQTFVNERSICPWVKRFDSHWVDY